MVRIQTVCGFGCGSSLFLKMKVEDVATCVSTPCDAIFISEELAERIKDRATVPVVVIKSFVNKNEVTEKTLAYFDSLK